MEGQTFSVALRVDQTEQLDFGTLEAWLACVAPGWFGVLEGEGTGNAHYHFLLRITARSIKAVRSKFVRDVRGLSGNASYSMKICDDEDKYRRYMCKGEDDESLPEWCTDPAAPSVLYTPDWVHAQHAAYWDENARYLEAAHARELARGKGNIVEQLEGICMRKNLKSREDIARQCMLLYKQWKKPLNVFYCRGVVNTVCLLLNAENALIEEDIIQSIVKL